MPPVMSAGSRTKDTGKKPHHHKLLMLTQIRQLLKNEFAFDGYMNHGQEDVEMGEWFELIIMVCSGFFCAEIWLKRVDYCLSNY